MIASLLSLTLWMPLLRVLPDGPDSFVIQAEFKASNPTSEAEFSECLALEGDLALVGSPIAGGDLQFAGAAYVFRRMGASWSQEARLLPLDSRSGDQFGRSVELAGNFAFVGADNALAAGGFVNGAVYVFQLQAGGWIQVARIEPADGAFGDGFGAHLAVSGNSLIVGAPGAGSSGKAYVFVGAGDTWIEQAQLVPSAGGQSGTIVDLESDTALVTSPLNASSRGAATLFTRTGSTWSQAETLLDVNRSSGERFGSSAALEADTLVVGSAQLDGNSGGALVFVRDPIPGNGWVLEQKLAPDPPAFASGFGHALALDGDTLLVGSPDDDALGSAQGAAYLYRRSASFWGLRQQLLPSTSPDDGEEFGIAVSLDGDRLAIGDVQGFSDPGELTIFEGRFLASVQTRNAGQNPTSYVAANPVLGASWNASVDLSLSGHSQAFLALSARSKDLLLGGGQTLLVDPASLGIPLVGPSAGPIASFQLSIPADMNLAGLVVYSQALHVGNVIPFALSNAQDLCLGE